MGHSEASRQCKMWQYFFFVCKQDNHIQYFQYILTTSANVSFVTKLMVEIMEGNGEISGTFFFKDLKYQALSALKLGIASTQLS